MHTKLTSIVVATAAVTSSAFAALKSGDSLTPDALGKAELIQGEAPKTWEPGKVYILECWATWCAPCVAAIPHVDALYDKYQEKGLRVIGVNVMEDGKDKVADFVKKKGDGMSYPVIYTGKGDSAFSADYLKPGGVRGIPFAFIIKDGKYLFGTHPAGLNEDLIEALIAGGEKQNAAIKGFTDREAQSGRLQSLSGEFQKATAAKDADAMAAAFAEIEKFDPKARYIPAMRARVQIAKKDWAGFDSYIQSLPEHEASAEALFRSAAPLDEQADVPAATLKAVLEKMLKVPAMTEGNGTNALISHVLISRYQWQTGDKEGAKANAKQAVEKAGETKAAPYAAYAASLETDKPQTFRPIAKNNCRNPDKRLVRLFESLEHVQSLVRTSSPILTPARSKSLSRRWIADPMAKHSGVSVPSTCFCSERLISWLCVTAE